MSDQIQRADFNDRIKQSLGLRGFSPVQTVTPEITPILLVDDLREPDVRKLGVTIRRGYGHVTKGAVVANNGYCKFANPAGSGYVLRVTSLDFVGTAAATAWIQVTRASNASDLLDGLQQVGVLGNFRLEGQTCCARFSSESTGGAIPLAPFLLRTRTPVDFHQLYEVDIVVPPGSGLLFCNETLNNPMAINVAWVEYPIDLYP